MIRTSAIQYTEEEEIDQGGGVDFSRGTIRFFLITSSDKGAGKDEVSNFIYNELRDRNNVMPRHIKFADPLMTAYKNVFGTYIQDFHKLSDGEREKVINFSRTCKEIQEDVWIKKTLEAITQDIDQITSTWSDNLAPNEDGIFNIDYIFSDHRYHYERMDLEALIFDLEEYYDFNFLIYTISVEEARYKPGGKVVPFSQLVDKKVTDRDDVGLELPQPDYTIINEMDGLDKLQNNTLGVLQDIERI